MNWGMLLLLRSYDDEILLGIPEEAQRHNKSNFLGNQALFQLQITPM